MINNLKTLKFKKNHRKKRKTLKIPNIIYNDIPKFYQHRYNSDSNYINNNTKPKLITSHRTYYPCKKRIIVLGDIHGDLDALIECLIIAKVIKIPDNVKVPPYKIRNNKNMYEFFHKIIWIGDDTFVIQLGDQIDRTRPVDWDSNDIGIGKTINDEGSSLHIFFLMWYLNCIAKINGGRVINILGNHEIMNIDADFRYVSPFEFEEYYNGFHNFYKNTIDNNEDNNKIKGYNERKKAFSRGNLISNFFGINYKLVVQIGKWLFMHAGLTKNICKYNSICKINNSISRYLLNINDKNSSILYKRVINCNSNKSCIWNRDFGDINDDNDDDYKLLEDKFNDLLQNFNETNKKYHIKYKIPNACYVCIGHTPQFYNNMGINSLFNKKIWRCDIGMSKAFGDNHKNINKYRLPQVLEILDDDKINILTK